MRTPPPITPENLPEELQRGNELALEYLYDSYSAALYGIVMKMVNDDKLGQDLLQECFVKIWKKREQYDANKGSLFTWMLNLSRNHCIDYLRSKRHKNRQQNRGIDNHVYHLESQDNFNPEHIGVKKMLDELPEEQRMVLEFSYFKGYTQKEIAEEFSLPLGTVKSRAKAALDKLRKIFKPHNDNL